MIKYEWERNSKISDKDISRLYRNCGQVAIATDPDLMAESLKNSTVLWALDDDNLIGLVRVITDRTTILFVQDLLVEPKYYQQKIDSSLLRELLRNFNNVSKVVAIGNAERKTKDFYQSFGFFEVTPESFGITFILDRRFK